MAETNKFAQLKQFWQKGKKEDAPASGTQTPLHSPASVSEAKLPPEVQKIESTPTFDPYGVTDDLSFVPEDQTEEKVEQSQPESLYTLDEHFEPEKETDGHEERASTAQLTTSSLYATDETFTVENASKDEDSEDEEVVTNVKCEVREEEDNDNRYSAATTSDVAYAMDDEFNPETKPAVVQTSAPSYGADSSSFNDIYGAADVAERFSPADDAYVTKDVNYSSTPYESFQPDSPSTAYYSGAIDEVVVEDKETNDSLYGEEDDGEPRQASAYGTDDVEGVAEQGGDEDAKSDESESDSDSDSDSDDDGDKFTTAKPHRAKDWNSEFQNLLDMPPSSEKFNKLARLAHDFVFAASTYGKIIISELGLPVEKKTIKPIAVGGQAGGEKYIVQGIFFKFALDIFGIYGGDEYAMKAASHDLKGLIHYYSCQIPGLHVPLMALIDYLGFRLIAITILPISSSTIKYGSSDAGQTVHADDPILNKMMKQAGQKMKLQGHHVGVPGGQSRRLYAPVDIEGHLGLDGRYYVVDFARTFPPERPSPENMKRKGIILYNLLRPELVKSNDVPLSPDAFTLWAKADENKDQYNSAVTTATRRLIKEVIPKVAQKLDEMQEKSEKGQTHLDLIEIIHSAGVNVRHLGYVRRAVTAEKVRSKIMVEMISRVVRKQLQEKFRSKTRSAGIPTEEPHKLAAVKYLNKLLGRHHNSTHHWHALKRALLHKFPKCLLSHETKDGYDLRQHITVQALFDRLQKLAPNIFVLTDEARQDFNKALEAHDRSSWDQTPPDFKFLPSDVQPLAASIKHMNLIDIAEASSMFYGSLDESGTDQVRLLIQGLGKFQVAARKMPFIDVDTIVTLGDMLVARASECKKSGTRTAEYESAVSGSLIAYQTALNINPKNSRCLMGLGDIYAAKEEHVQARDMYREALAAQPDLAEAHYRLALTYARDQWSNDAKGELQMASLRQALACNPDYYEALVDLGNLVYFLTTNATLRLGELEAKRREAEAEEQTPPAGEESEPNKETVETVKEKVEKLQEEMAGLYNRALAIKPGEYDAFTPIHTLVRSLARFEECYQPGKDVGLSVVWRWSKSSSGADALLTHLLAQMSEVHFELFKFGDDLFEGLAARASALLRVFFQANVGLTEAGLRRWLSAHPTPLRAISLHRCPQLGDDFLSDLASSIHRASLETLVVSRAESVSRNMLLHVFAAQHEGVGWPSLTELDLSGTPFDGMVLAALARASPALVDLRFASSQVDNEILAGIPPQLTRLHLGGRFTHDALHEAFAQRCTALTHVSLKGVDGLSLGDCHSLAEALPGLLWFQFPAGAVHLWSGPSAVKVQYEQRGVSTFQIVNGEHYRILEHVTTQILGKDLCLVVSGNNTSKTVNQDSQLLLQATMHNTVAGWNMNWPWRRGQERLPMNVKYNQMMKQMQITPNNIASVNIVPFANTASITIQPNCNITLTLLALFIALRHK